MMDKNTIVLVGQTNSGKTTVAKLLEAYGYKRIVTYTTRPKRQGERDEIDYNFVTDEKFKSMIKNGDFAEYTEYNALFGHVYYGSSKEDYLSDDKKVIVLNPCGLLALQRNLIPHTSIYLDVSMDELLRRASKRGDDMEEVKRRLKDDKEKFQDIESKVDIIIKDGTLEEILEAIIL